METLNELWQYLVENYFSAELGKNYLHLNFRGMHTSLLVLIGGLCLGLFLASFLSFFSGRRAARLVKALRDKEAFDPQSAKTLDELHLSSSPFLKRELSKPSLLRKWVCFCEGEKIYRYRDELAEAFSSPASEPSEGPQKAFSSEDDCSLTEKNKSPEKELYAPSDGNPDRNKKKKGSFSFRLHSPDMSLARFFLPEENRENALNYYEKRGGSILMLLLSVLLSVALFFLALRFLPTLISLLDVSIDKWVKH